MKDINDGWIRSRILELYFVEMVWADLLHFPYYKVSNINLASFFESRSQMSSSFSLFSIWDGFHFNSTIAQLTRTHVLLKDPHDTRKILYILPYFKIQLPDHKLNIYS
jgi:hypothetical protein